MRAGTPGWLDGDAFRPSRSAELDEQDAFPAEAVAALDEAGLAEYYTIDRWGRDFREPVGLLREVARRDLTVAIAHGKTFLGTVPVWLAGTAEQRERLAERVRAGAPVAWALTEPQHGSDLMADELTATRSGAGWRLHGVKWPINNATRARLVCVLARTEPAGGGRGFGLFLVDTDRLPAGTWRPLPKVRTHGIRGADISGLELRDAPVPPDALVGAPGEGLDIVLRSLQLTRIAVTSLSLGAADHALRTAREFAAGRELYGHRLSDVPHVRRILGRAAAGALVAEAVGVLATGAVHALPGELSVISAVTKAFVPTAVQAVTTGIAELLGARGFLTGPPGGGGAFAKLERDHRICAIFDGSTTVNRAALIHQLPRLGRLLRSGRADRDGVTAAATVGGPHVAVDPARLALRSATGDSIVQSLPALVEDLAGRATPQLVALAGSVLDEARRLEHDLLGFVPAVGGLPATAFVLAERYERFHAAAACLLLWWHEREAVRGDLRAGDLWADDLWPTACLAHLLDRTDGAHDPVFDRMATVLLGWTRPAFTVLPDPVPADPVPAAAGAG